VIGHCNIEYKDESLDVKNEQRGRKHEGTSTNLNMGASEPK